MLITVQDTDLANQITQDDFIFNAAAPGYAPLLLAEIDWGTVTFAEYALTNQTLSHYLPHPGDSTHTPFPGDPAGFTTQVFENALGRAPAAAEITYYENVISQYSNGPLGALQGYAVALTGIALSPESYQHIAHLHS